MRKSQASILLLGLLVSGMHAIGQSQQAAFKKVKVRFNPGGAGRRMVEKGADLILDDASRRFVVKSADKPLELDYDRVERVIFDSRSHMRGGRLTKLIVLPVPVPLPAGDAIESMPVTDRLCYFEYRMTDGNIQPYMLKIDPDSSEHVIVKIRNIFGARATISDFGQQPREIEKKRLKDLQSKHTVRIDKKNHPVPEAKPDKALIVVVSPSVVGRTLNSGIQYKLHANDYVVAVTKPGTYSFCYLDPGEYLLAAQAGNASGILIKLEAGQGYYFLQSTFSGAWKDKTVLSRHDKGIVMYELDGAYYSDWKRK